jgi:hypothetical protein
MQNCFDLQALLDIIRSHPEHTEDKPHYISIYRRIQCYGGPEEGGWWYHRNILQSHIAFPSKKIAETWLEQAESLADQINKKEAPERNKALANLPDIETAYHDEGYIPQGWNDGGELWVTIEESLGASDTSQEPAPHYC